MEFLREVQGALPLVPASENDCCARVLDRTDLPARDAAREWITFLRALSLAEKTPSGYRRLRHEFDADTLAETFRNGVFGVEELRDVLAADEPLGTDEAFERFRHRVPEWERHRSPDWEAEWRERVRRLLGWAVEFGLAERIGDEYRVA